MVYIIIFKSVPQWYVRIRQRSLPAVLKTVNHAMMNPAAIFSMGGHLLDGATGTEKNCHFHFVFVRLPQSLHVHIVIGTIPRALCVLFCFVK